MKPSRTIRVTTALAGITVLSLSLFLQGCGGDKGGGLEKKFDSATGPATIVEMPKDPSKYKLLSEIPEGDYVLEGTRISMIQDLGGFHMSFPYNFDSRSLGETDCKVDLKKDSAYAVKGSGRQLGYSLPIVAGRITSTATRHDLSGAEVWDQGLWFQILDRSSCSAMAKPSDDLTTERSQTDRLITGARFNTARIKVTNSGSGAVISEGVYELKPDSEYIYFIEIGTGSDHKMTTAIYYKRSDLNSQTIHPTYAGASSTPPATEPTAETSQGFEPARSIPLNQREEQVVQARASGAGGISRNAQGNSVQLKTPEEAKAYALNYGFDTQAAEQYYGLSHKTGGLLTFANSAADVSSSILDMMGDMKDKINHSDSDSLDIAFILDYSGSMSDDIGGVIAGLEDVTRSIDTVKQTGRNVRVGIVLFGEPGFERVSLPLTADMSAVRSKLEDLLARHPSDQSSADPGEACYHGICTAGTQLGWGSAAQRMGVVITDEGSWEVDTNDQTTIGKAMALVSSGKMNTTIYSIVTKN